MCGGLRSRRMGHKFIPGRPLSVIPASYKRNTYSVTLTVCNIHDHENKAAVSINYSVSCIRMLTYIVSSVPASHTVQSCLVSRENALQAHHRTFYTIYGHIRYVNTYAQQMKMCGRVVSRRDYGKVMVTLI